MASKKRSSIKIGGIDIAVFIFALIMSATIWIVHNLTLNYTKVVSVPVVAVSNLEGRSQKSSNVASFMTRCRTRGYDIMRLENASEGQPIELEIAPQDLGHTTGDVFFLTPADAERYVPAIFGEDVIEATVADTLFFKFPEESHKKVPVFANYSISFKNQYATMSGLKTEPDSVIVYGEPHHLENIDRVFTQHFELDELSAPMSGEVMLEAPSGIRLSQNSAEYSIDVERYVEISATMQIRSRNVPNNKRLIIYPPVAKVSFRCSYPVTVEPDKYVHFYIDYNDFTQSLNGECIAKADEIPSGVIGYSMDPQVFECIESVR